MEIVLKLADNLAYLVLHKLPYPSLEDTIAIISAADDYVEAMKVRNARPKREVKETNRET